MLLRVVAVSSLLAASLAAQDEPLPTLKVDVRIVRLATSVTRPNHSFVTGLTARDFRILEDGVDQPIKYFWRESDLPLTVAIVVDISGSQLKELKDHQQRVRRFLKQVLRPQDKALLVTVASKVKLIHDVTSHADVLADDVERLSPRWVAETGGELGEPCRPKLDFARGRSVPCGGSLIWNSVFWTARHLRNVEGRKAILLLTDGEDTGSDHSLDRAIREAQAAESAIFSIGVRGTGGGSNRFRNRDRGLNREALFRLSEESGGVSFLERQSPREIFTRIEQELRNQYVLGYSSTACDNKFHRLDIRSPLGTRARSRRGYYAAGCAEVSATQN